MGIRAEESSNRAKRGRISNFGKEIHFHPIFMWNEGDIWEYIEKYEIPYCSLYDEGFSRIGCMICPYILGSNKSGEYNKRLKTAMIKWPRVYRHFEKIVNEYVFERRKAEGRVREDNFKEYIENWYKGIKIKSGFKK